MFPGQAHQNPISKMFKTCTYLEVAILALAYFQPFRHWPPCSGHLILAPIQWPFWHTSETRCFLRICVSPPYPVWHLSKWPVYLGLSVVKRLHLSLVFSPEDLLDRLGLHHYQYHYYYSHHCCLQNLPLVLPVSPLWLCAFSAF